MGPTHQATATLTCCAPSAFRRLRHLGTKLQPVGTWTFHCPKLRRQVTASSTLASRTTKPCIPCRACASSGTPARNCARHPSLSANESVLFESTNKPFYQPGQDLNRRLVNDCSAHMASGSATVPASPACLMSGIHAASNNPSVVKTGPSTNRGTSCCGLHRCMNPGNEYPGRLNLNRAYGCRQGRRRICQSWYKLLKR